MTRRGGEFDRTVYSPHTRTTTEPQYVHAVAYRMRCEPRAGTLTGKFRFLPVPA